MLYKPSICAYYWLVCGLKKTYESILRYLLPQWCLKWAHSEKVQPDLFYRKHQKTLENSRNFQGLGAETRGPGRPDS